MFVEVTTSGHNTPRSDFMSGLRSIFSGLKGNCVSICLLVIGYTAPSLSLSLSLSLALALCEESMRVSANSCGGSETVVAKATVRIEAEYEIATARKIAEFPTSVLPLVT